MEKKLVFIDMDGVIADFLHPFKYEQRGYGNYHEMHDIGFFENLPPMPHALVNVRKLLNHPSVDLWILSQPVKESAHSYSEKARWVMKWFPELAHKMILTQAKEHIASPGRVLIDDNNEKWAQKWQENGGEFVWFNESDPTHSWTKVFQHLGIGCDESN